MIDREYLGRQTAGDAGLERELLTLCLAQMASLRDLLSGTVPAATDLSPRLHRLRGAVAAVGARALAASLAGAELALDRDPADPSIPEVLRIALAEACVTMAMLIAAMPPAGLANDGESR